ncbi:MAG TPA: PilZ-like domain-containing protein [Desulfuromonadaceae bacterium]
MSDPEQYASFFPVGIRVGVGIPMQNNELFRDWAIVRALDEDLAEVQLSRDVLPADVNMQTGKVLELHVGQAGKGYRCSGVYVSSGAEGTLFLRLTGEVNSSELREYYRIDTFLPFQFRVSEERTLDKVLQMWRDRREQRLVEEMERREEMRLKRREQIFRIAEGDVAEEGREGEQPAPAPLPEEEAESDHIDPVWDTVLATAVNLSAGGFKFVTADPFELGQIVFLELFIPTSPPRIMDSVGRVVFKNRNYFAGNDREYWNVAFQFLFIDERDRDAIVRLISNLELVRIRMMRQKSLLDDGAAAGRGFMGPLKMAVAGLLLIALIALIVGYMRSYSNSPTKNEIQETFESGIRKLLEKYK